MSNITIDELKDTIQKITKEYGEHAKRVLEESADIAADEAVKTLKSTSPKRSGKYAKSWAKKAELTVSGGPKRIVHVKKPHFRLTHLLEYGHATRSGGRTRAFPHIKPAEQEAIKRYEEELRKKL